MSSTALSSSLGQTRLLDWQTIPTSKGSLSIVEGARLPFDIQRLYYFHGLTPDARRGGHAHSNLQQVIIAVHGSFSVLLDDGAGKVLHRLDDPCRGLYIPPMTWLEMFDFSDASIGLVLASLPYERTEYLRNYPDFVALVRRDQE